MKPSDHSVNYSMLARDTKRHTQSPFFHQDLIQRAGKFLEILLHFVFYDYRVMFGLTEEDLRKIETCYVGNILFLH